MLNLVFDRDAESVRQPDFYFLGEKVIRWPLERKTSPS